MFSVYSKMYILIIFNHKEHKEMHKDHKEIIKDLSLCPLWGLCVLLWLKKTFQFFRSSKRNDKTDDSIEIFICMGGRHIPAACNIPVYLSCMVICIAF